MSTPTFERTAPVYAGRKIVIAIDSDNPLSTQLEMITGDGWNSIDWTDTLRTGEITHKKSGLVVKVLDSVQKTTLAVIKQSTDHEKLLAEGWKFCGLINNPPIAGKFEDLKATMLKSDHGEERLVVGRPDGAAACYYREKLRTETKP